ncbi:MAG: DNA translocase FtsK 4TM domain-containing protein [Clostridiales bacterium]|nr:DNA translocase FtsK 4TM domain-containing protein [Clostridiales bacterium]
MSRDTSRKEAAGIVLFFVAVAIILIFYLPVSLTGIIGATAKDFFLGLIGISAYAIPVYILYVALDVFFEKRQGVSGIRVRSMILLLVSVSALLALISMDMEYFRGLCLNPDGNTSALKALSLLWQSGTESEVIGNPINSAPVLTGGIIGGAIAVALNEVIGKVIGVLAIIVFLLTQILLVFRVSIKATAKKTAHAIATTSGKVYNTVVSHKNQRQNDPDYQIYSGNGYGSAAPQRPVQRPAGQTVITYGDGGLNYPDSVKTGNSPFVQSPGPGNEKQGPFMTNLPIDGATGFTDVEKLTGGQIHAVQQDPGKLTFNEKEYDVSGRNDPEADFGYITDPLNVPGAAKVKKQKKTLSFLEPGKKEDFYDLSPEKKDDGEKYIENDIFSGSEDLYEVSEGSEGSGYDYSPERSVREPRIRPSVYDRLSDNASDTPASVSAYGEPDGKITINQSNDNTEGFSRTEGRIIKTSSHSDADRSAPGIEFAEETRKHEAEIRNQKRKLRNYKPAPTSCLAPDIKQRADADLEKKLKAKAHKLEDALKSFGISAEVVNITHGPSITRFELTLETGTKVSRVTGLQDDIMLAMAAISIRIEAPIPGKSAIGIEIPNDVPTAVQLRGLVETKDFKASTPLTVALGRDIPGRPIYCDLAKMPHLMIAGSTGSGKSVCINSILTSILVHSSPEEVRMILVDPKVVELSVYNGVPHLIMPVITDPKKAAGALNWAVMEMQRRYKLFEEGQVRDIKGFNEKYKNGPEEHLPLILIVIDELAELMMVAAKEVETYISRLAALARAAGIHLLIATQRPSVDVITGVIKANIGSRIAFAVTSGVDSRTILDQYGAEKLLGKGDMLYAPMSAPQPVRGQGAFLSDNEVETVVNFLKKTYGSMYDEMIIKDIDRVTAGGDQASGSSSGGSSGGGSDADDLFNQAVQTVIENGSASVSVLQRRLGIGYPRAARLIDELEKAKVIGPFEGSKPRKILITETEWLEMQARQSNG